MNQRKGKLVATDPKTGKLPANIVPISPVLAIPPQGVGVSGTATLFTDGVSFSGAGTGELRFGFVVPPAHDPDSQLQVDVVYREDSAGACSWTVATSGLEGPRLRDRSGHPQRRLAVPRQRGPATTAR